MPNAERSEKVVDIRARRKKDKNEELDVVALKKSAVDQYSLEGYSLFALSRSKKPLKGSKTVNTPYDPLVDASDFPHNYGVVLKPDDLVIDVDKRAYAKRVAGRLVKRSGKPYSERSPWASCSDDVLNELDEGESDDPLKRFLRDAGLSDNPDTYVVRTGSGGYHVHFKIQPGTKTRLRLADYPGLEFKRSGQYIVGPGSIHPKTGKPYTIKKGKLERILIASDELVGLIRRSDHYDSIGLPDFVEDDAAVGSVTAFFKQCAPAIEGDYGDPHTVEMARYGYDMGLHPDKTFELMLEHFNPRCSPPWDDDELRRKVYSAYKSSKDKLGNRHPLSDFADYEDDLDEEILSEEEYGFSGYKNFDDKGRLASNDLGNTLAYLVDPEYRVDEDGKTVRIPNPLFRNYRYNQLKEDVEYIRRAPWHEDDETPVLDDGEEAYLLSFFSHKLGYRTNITALRNAIFTVAKMAKYNPVKDYLNSLEWDGVPRLHTLLHKYAGAENTPLNAEIGKNVLLAAVYRVFQPGCQYDNVLVLEGDEGNGKSTFVRILGGPFGRTVTIDVNRRADTVQAMLGGWILEAPEMVFVRKYEANAVKEIITTPTDTIRLPYARRSQDYARRSIIIGTCNPGTNGYLTSETGNRRFWPVKTGEFDLDGLREVRDQLFAEAIALYKAGKPYHIIDKELVQEMMAQQADREVKNSMAEHIDEILNPTSDNDDELYPIPEKPTMTWLSQRLGFTAKDVNMTTRNILTKAMSDLGYKYVGVNRWKGHFEKENPDADLEGLL